MTLRFLIDDDSGLPHIAAHNVSEQEVHDVLRRPLENLPGRRNSRIVIGRTQIGRLLKVICVPDATGPDIFVVTAFDLKGKPLIAFNRRMRHRGQS